MRPAIFYFIYNISLSENKLIVKKKEKNKMRKFILWANYFYYIIILYKGEIVVKNIHINK